MKDIIKRILLLTFISMLTACNGGGSSPSGPGLSAEFTPDSVSPGSGTVALQKNSISGNTIYLDILATDVAGLFGADIKIDYDAAKVSWGGSHQVGDQFAGGNSYSNLDGGVEGRVVIGVTAASEVNGDLVIVTVPFKVIGSGTSVVTFSVTSRLTDSTAPVPNEISISNWYGGTLEGI